MFRAFYLLAATLCLTLVLAACDSGGDAGPEAIDCESRTGNSMTARVDGQALCTDLGMALLLDAAGPRLSVLGLFATSSPGASISFSVENPAVGTFDLTDALYASDDESVNYTVNDREGSGSVTITELTDTRVKGTFAFTGAGSDINLNPTGDQAEVTDGTFDFAVATTTP